MRRGRIIGGVSALLAAATMAAAPGATAATPMDICRDLADNGRIDGNYSAQELQNYVESFLHDPTLQGYCLPLVLPPSTTTVTTTTPGETTNTTTTVVNDNTPTTTTSTTTTPSTTTTNSTSTSVVGGTTTTETNGGGPATTPTTTTTGVAGARKTKTTPAPQQAAPLSSTRPSGTLPFTGAELAVFAVVGAALLGGGLLLRLTARQRRTQP